LAAIGHPIIGDKVYGSAGFLKNTDPVVRLFPRQALHAEEIQLLHPVTETVLQIRAPYPADFLSLLKIFHELSKNHERTVSC
jgi:23S rRNA pseudouridine1911/1915/1917 synthase